MKKRGLSAIVSTILLIVFVISLGVMIMSWSGGLISKSIKKSETRIGSELECDNVKLKLEKVEYKDEIIIKNNGNKDLYGYVVREIDNSDGVKVFEKAEELNRIKSYSAGTYAYTSGIKKIEIIPRISIEKEEIVDCTNKIGAYTFKNE